MSHADENNNSNRDAGGKTGEEQLTVENLTILRLIESHCGDQQAHVLLEDIVAKYMVGIRGCNFQEYIRQIAAKM